MKLCFWVLILEPQYTQKRKSTRGENESLLTQHPKSGGPCCKAFSVSSLHITCLGPQVTLVCPLFHSEVGVLLWVCVCQVPVGWMESLVRDWA